jgi:hypothetical protein
MANILTLTDAQGQTVVTCPVYLKIEIDADDAYANIINTAIAQGSVSMNIVGNSVPESANATLMYSNLTFNQIQPLETEPQSGTMTVVVI